MTEAARATGYRPDIDGLRAVAIAPVLLFHAAVPGFSGGYVGVDVFFVISGFLITSILVRELSTRGQLSFSGFYERRARRILPALFVVLLAACLAAPWLLLPADLVAFARSLSAGTLFYANLHFQRLSGYFATTAELRPLLHLWSLAVEEQFYFTLPIVVWLAMRFGRNVARGVLLALLLASLAWAERELSRGLTSAPFFSAPQRAWELLVGGLLALAVPRVGGLRVGVREPLAVVGLLAIALPVSWYDGATRFPGALALPPTLGAAAVLYAGPQSLVGRVLSLRPFVAMGRVSYGLYLWHWPLLAYLRHYALPTPSVAARLCALVFAFVLAAISYRFVELPIRAGRVLSSRRAMFSASAAGILAFAGLGAWGVRAGGFPHRLPGPALALAGSGGPTSNSYFEGRCGWRGRYGCRFGEGPPRLLLWGDSHAKALAPALMEPAHHHGVAGEVVSRAGCPPLLGIGTVADVRGKSCAKHAATILERVAKLRYPAVYLSARWSYWAEGHIVDAEGTPLSAGAEQHLDPAFCPALIETLSALSKLGAKVVVVEDVPERPFTVPDALAKLAWWGRDLELRVTRAEHARRQRFARACFSEARAKVSFRTRSLDDALCGPVRCELVRDGVTLYRDEDHLSIEGAKLLAPVFAADVAAMAAPARPSSPAPSSR